MASKRTMAKAELALSEERQDLLSSTVDATEELRQSYGEYAIYTIMDRALPDVRDGFKPVHRRIAFTMYESKLFPSANYKKSATTVGNALGWYHPHGDSSVYDAMVRMAQDFSLRSTLVDGNGNFGSMDGDPPAAYRYTEARLTPVAMELLADLEDDTVEWKKNFDESRKEPVVLPGRFPNLLVNGSSGIAVGMATNMPAHNLREVVKGLIAYADNPKATTAELMKHVKGPDFPTGGIIVGKEGIKEAYETGQGTLTVRARMHLEEERGRPLIVVTELPYMTTRSKVVAAVAEATRAKTETGAYLASAIADAQDYTDKDTPRLSTRIVIELRKDADPNRVMGLLLKQTPLQQTFAIKNLCLVPDRNGRMVPQYLGLRELMEQYFRFQVEVIRRRTQSQLERLNRELHILEGKLVAFQDIDAVIKVIKPAQGRADAVARLMKAFKVTEVQAEAVAMLRLYEISKVDIGAYKKEYEEKKAHKKELESILKSDDRKKAVIRDDLERMAAAYGDARRTSIESADAAAAGNFELAAVAEVPEERVLLLATGGGYAKRVPLAFRGTAAKAFTLDSGDQAAYMAVASTLDEVWFLTDDQAVHFVPVGSVAALDRADRGKPLSNLIGSGAGLRGFAVVPRELRGSGEAFLVTSSREGLLKRTALADYATNRSSIQGFVEKGEDRVTDAAVMGGDTNVLATSSDGMTVHFPLVGDPAKPVVPAQGRASAGVGAIKLAPGAAMLPLAHYPAKESKDQLLLVLTDQGYGRFTAVGDFPVTNRNVKGVKTLPLDPKKHGHLAVTLAVGKAARKSGSMLCLLESGGLLKVPLASVPLSDRATRVQRAVDVPAGDRIVAAVLEA